MNELFWLRLIPVPTLAGFYLGALLEADSSPEKMLGSAVLGAIAGLILYLIVLAVVDRVIIEVRIVRGRLEMRRIKQAAKGWKR